jgi:hypothetical protein
MDRSLLKHDGDIIVVYGQREPYERHIVSDSQVRNKILAYGIINAGLNYAELDYFMKPQYFSTSFLLYFENEETRESMIGTWRFATAIESRYLYEAIERGDIVTAWDSVEMAVKRTKKYLDKFVEFELSTLVMSSC